MEPIAEPPQQKSHTYLRIAKLVDTMLDASRPWFEAPIVLIPLTALWTALIAEPMKSAVSNRLKRRHLRRIILAEILSNLNWLHRGVDWLAPSGEDHFKDSVRRSASRVAYEICQREFYIYYQLSEHEWIDTFFSAMEKIPVSEQGPENLAHCAELAHQLTEQCVDYFKRHPGTWSVVGADAPSDLRKRINPTLWITWVTAWRNLKADLRELRLKTESGDGN